MRTLVARQTPEDTSSEKPSSLRCILRPLAEYGTAVILCLLILVWAMKLWEADLATPFGYWHDGLMVQAYIKTGIDNPWYWQNHYQGMPATLQSADYPAEISASFLFLLIKLLSVALPQSALVMNLFYLANFPLVTLSALFVLRSLRLSYAPALVMSLLYTFIPYHFYHGEIHLFLAAYFTVPFMVMLILWSFLDPPLFFTWEPVRQRLTWSVRGLRPFASLALCILIGCSQIYYAFFTCFFLLVAAVSSAFSRKSLYPLCSNLLLVATITGVGVANLAPSIMYHWKHGRNQVVQRPPGDSEVFGLKIVQLLMPVNEHRLHLLRKIKDRYVQGAPLINENNFSSLGCVAGTGFLLLVGRLFYRKSGSRRPKLMDKLSTLNIGALLLGTIGGIGSLVAFTGSPWIRAYSRLSIFIGFFALMAVGLLLDKVRRRYAKSAILRIAYYGCLAVLLTAGILDQTASYCVPPYAAVQQRYGADAEFVAAIEASVPPHAMIFQLPYLPFPTYLTPNAMHDLDHFRGYLHSKTLRWSYPAMLNREADVWQRAVVANQPEELVKRLVDAGFSGVYINRDGYADRACALEAALARITNAKPIESSNRQFAFFKLETVEHSGTAEQAGELARRHD